MLNPPTYSRDMVDAIRCECGRVVTAGPSRDVIFTTSQHLQKSDCGPDDWGACKERAHELASADHDKVPPQTSDSDNGNEEPGGEYDGEYENPIFETPMANDDGSGDGGDDAKECSNCGSGMETVDTERNVYAVHNGTQKQVTAHEGDHFCNECGTLTDGDTTVMVLDK